MTIAKGLPVLEGPLRQIIGIVGDVRAGHLSSEPGPTMYVPWAQLPDVHSTNLLGMLPISWMVRTRAAPYALGDEIQNALREAIGIYGLTAYSVEQRAQEIGIRMAMGADTGGVRNMVIRQGMTVAFIGVAIGLTSALGLSRLNSSFLFGVTSRDPLVFVAVPIVLSTVALLGVWIPARRAARIEPAASLRME
jgi:hypothetical protein